MSVHWNCLNEATNIFIETTNVFVKYYASNYSRLPLSRHCLARIIAYLEVKISPLFLQGHLSTSNKILWKRGEIAPPVFHNIFNISLISGVKLHIRLLTVLFDLMFFSFPQI